MLVRAITAFVIVGAGISVGAQTPQSIQMSSADQSQLQAFENSLRVAIAKAGSQLAARARQAAPNIQLQFESEARIKAMMLPDGEGIQCFVDVPGIRPDSVVQWEISRLLNTQRRQPDSARPVGVGTVASAATSDPADPVLMTDPVREYSGFAHDALVEAILDGASSVPVKSMQMLTLIVGDGTSGLPSNPLAEPPRLLYLRIKGEDLIALRDTRITREEAKKRIRQWVY
jgi:hypothetical protein